VHPFSRSVICLLVSGLAGAALEARRADGPGSGTRRSAPAAAVAIHVGTETIRIDGDLSEEIWTKAPPITEFLQRDPQEGGKPTHETEARVLFDDAALYVAVRALEPEPVKIVGHLTRRDEGSPSDWIRVIVDSYRDGRTAYEFAVNAAGVKQDRYWFNDTNSDMSWDAVWDVAVARSNQGWRAEFRIPFSQLRFNPAASASFGFAIVRTVAHLNETATWPLLARSASGYVSSFGELTGLAFSGAQKRLELAPYAVAQLTTAPIASGNPLVRSPDPDASVGLDLKYKVAAGLTLTGTVNPDFGQVEADPAVVNLGAFETFFAERRPFFVEGSGNFSFDLDCNDGQCTGLFYSRRIGRPPHRFLDPPDNGYAAQPSNSTIIGAAKLTGRLGKFSIGALNALTMSEEAEIASGPDLVHSTSPVEPFTSYSVMRANREFADRSRLGFIVTSTNRNLQDELRFVPETAVTGGVDGDWRLGKGGYSLTGYWAGSTVRGDAAAIDRLQRSNVHSFQRPDASHLTYDPARTQLDGHAGSASFNKISGERLRGSSFVGYKSPGFDINDLGFQERADSISLSNWYQIRDDKPGAHVRNRNVNFNQWMGWNFDGDLRSSGGNVNSHWTLTNNMSFGSGFNVNAEGFDDRLTRGGPGGLVTGGLSQWGYFNSDERRKFSFYVNFSWNNDLHDSTGWSFDPGINYRPAAALLISVGPGMSVNDNQTQWVENVATGSTTHYVFGRIDQTTVGISTRVNYTMTPALSLQIYARPFVSTGKYSNFKELVDGRAPRYEDRYAPYAYADNPDFNYRSFRTTNVLRWEYRPGSALFVVWQQGREETGSQGDFKFDRDFTGAFHAPATNVFLVKFSRWLNF
jgi:uncharacterized protein DUF5916/cellulose/xylan binding protein with CBM9 domain